MNSQRIRDLDRVYSREKFTHELVAVSHKYVEVCSAVLIGILLDVPTEDFLTNRLSHNLSQKHLKLYLV